MSSPELDSGAEAESEQITTLEPEHDSKLDDSDELFSESESEFDKPGLVSGDGVGVGGVVATAAPRRAAKSALPKVHKQRAIEHAI